MGLGLLLLNSDQNGSIQLNPFNRKVEAGWPGLTRDLSNNPFIKKNIILIFFIKYILHNMYSDVIIWPYLYVIIYIN